MSTTHQFSRRHSSAIPYAASSKLGHHIHHTGVHTGVHSYNGKHPELSRSLQTRRISEGETSRYKDMFRCNSCGKSYKHTSSLSKHLWEHTPEWRMTKKLLISKHQQVQLLEAASILVGMNEPGVPADVPQSPYSRSVPYTGHEYGEEDMLQTPGEQIPSSYSPMPGCVGGYIDVPTKKRISRMTSISDITDVSHVLKEEEEEGVETEKTRSEEDANEEEEIVGKME